MHGTKRILLIIPNLDFGGAQNSFSRISLLLQPYFTLKLVVFNKDNMAPLIMGGELVDLQVPASKNLYGKISNFFRRVTILKKIKKEFDPHISISFLEGADYVNLLSKHKDQILFYVHGSKRFDKNIRGLIGFFRLKILLPVFYSRAEKILVVNDQIAKELKTHFNLSRCSFEVMPNFYDFTEIQRLANLSLSSSEELFFKKNKVICISGRIAPEKGIDFFIKIWPQLVSRNPAIKLILVGDGPQKEAVKNDLQRMGVRYFDVIDDNLSDQTDASVFFLGYQTNPYKYMFRSYMLLLPSLNEGMPNTIVEAMGLGVPVIAADCPYGPRELLSKQKSSTAWPDYSDYGILVPVLNSQLAHQSWLNAIETLINDSTLHEKYKKIGYEKAKEFSQERMIDRWRELLSVKSNE